MSARGGLRVLVVGDGFRGSLTDSYCRAFERLGATVTLFDQAAAVRRHAESLAWRGIWAKVTTLPVATEFNLRFSAFVRACPDLRPDLVFVNKGIFFFRHVLERLKRRTGAVVFHLFNDDYFHRTMSSRHAVDCLPVYDCIFTPAKFNIPELERAGAARVEYLPFGYDTRFTGQSGAPAFSDRCDVVFVGAWRSERREVLETLAEQPLPGTLAIWGNAWERVPSSSPLRPYLQFRPALCEDMVRVLGASKIALAFVTRFGVGRLIHVMRTFEIPAAGAFMLAERAGGEQGEFFDEDREMACFDGAEELHDKVRFYLEHESERRRIAAAGLRRALASGYSYDDRARQVLRAYHECRA